MRTFLCNLPYILSSYPFLNGAKAFRATLILPTLIPTAAVAGFAAIALTARPNQGSGWKFHTVVALGAGLITQALTNNPLSSVAAGIGCLATLRFCLSKSVTSIAGANGAHNPTEPTRASAPDTAIETDDSDAASETDDSDAASETGDSDAAAEAAGKENTATFPASFEQLEDTLKKLGVRNERKYINSLLSKIDFFQIPKIELNQEQIKFIASYLKKLEQQITEKLKTLDETLPNGLFNTAYYEAKGKKPVLCVRGLKPFPDDNFVPFDAEDYFLNYEKEKNILANWAQEFEQWAVPTVFYCLATRWALNEGSYEYREYRDYDGTMGDDRILRKKERLNDHDDDTYLYKMSDDKCFNIQKEFKEFAIQNLDHGRDCILLSLYLVCLICNTEKEQKVNEHKFKMIVKNPMMFMAFYRYTQEITGVKNKTRELDKDLFGPYDFTRKGAGIEQVIRTSLHGSGFRQLCPCDEQLQRGRNSITNRLPCILFIEFFVQLFDNPKEAFSTNLRDDFRRKLSEELTLIGSVIGDVSGIVSMHILKLLKMLGHE
ncbi:MAG: hypothetical protein LVR00_00420 [Rhabdochlamydiaceae bacterium]|jgi:hypothetical protein